MNVTYCKADVQTQKCLRCIILSQTYGRDIELTSSENFLSLVLILPQQQLSYATVRNYSRTERKSSISVSIYFIFSDKGAK